MEFGILGPLYADAGTDHGAAIIRQPLQQAALAVLLLRANKPCPRQWLIEALWGSEPPTSPEASLRVCMSRLRRDLGDCAVRLTSVGPPGGRAPGHRLLRGYMMTVRAGELDIHEFSDLAGQGRADLDIGNWAAAAASLAQALALWGDPPLPNLPDTSATAAAVVSLNLQWRNARDDLIEARIATGECEQVLGQLRAAMIADPGHERTCEQLMRAYHALGMRKEALDTFQIARETTRAELGTEPGPLLSVLHKRILAEDLAASGRVANPVRLTQAELVRPVWQVPAPPRDFVGRERNIRIISEYLAEAGVPLVVITGGPGIGKTAIATTVAHNLRHAFPDGQLFAELGGLIRPRDPQQVLADILQSLGIAARDTPPAGPARSAMFRSLLADRRILVVADDAANAQQIRPLIPSATGAAILATSRSRLPGLAGARIVEVGDMPDDDAARLLKSASGTGRVVDEQGAAAIVAACSGLPLALRLAGDELGRRPGLSTVQMASELRDGRVC